MTATYLHEQPEGAPIEYRRHPWHPTVLYLEARLLRHDGTPYDDSWYPVSNDEILRLVQSGSDIVDLLA